MEAVREEGNQQAALSAVGRAAWYSLCPAVLSACADHGLWGGPVHKAGLSRCHIPSAFLAHNCLSVGHLIFIQARGSLAPPKELGGETKHLRGI